MAAVMSEKPSGTKFCSRELSCFAIILSTFGSGVILLLHKQHLLH